MLHGKGNTGQAREIWAIGDRVSVRENGRRIVGTVAHATREPNASEVHHTWVRWADGEAGYIDPNVLDVVR